MFSKFFLLVAFIFGIYPVFSQDLATKNQSNKTSKKNSLYIYWGWNRSAYTKSDIHFKGNNFDFTLFDVIAKDRQSKFDFGTYFAPTSITIPQYNFRIGYYLKDNLEISIGADHMKYVMQNDKIVKIKGKITETGTIYDGTYMNDDIVLKNEFLMFEHTDGLNYENIELRLHQNLLERKKVNISFFEGGGIGVMVPKTNATVLNNKRYDEFHVAGYGLGGVFGFNFQFFNYFFIQFENKLGFIHMPDIRVTEFKSDKARQHFFFAQVNGLFGFRIPLGSK